MWTTGPQNLIILIWLADMHYIRGNGVSLESAGSVSIIRLGNHAFLPFEVGNTANNTLHNSLPRDTLQQTLVTLKLRNP